MFQAATEIPVISQYYVTILNIIFVTGIAAGYFIIVLLLLLLVVCKMWSTACERTYMCSNERMGSDRAWISAYILLFGLLNSSSLPLPTYLLLFACHNTHVIPVAQRIDWYWISFPFHYSKTVAYVKVPLVELVWVFNKIKIRGLDDWNQTREQWRLSATLSNAPPRPHLVFTSTLSLWKISEAPPWNKQVRMPCRYDV